MTRRDSRKFLEVPIDLLFPSPHQTRLLDPNNLGIDELAESIRVHGILQPILVRQEGEKYEVIAGLRRWKAAQSAGLKTVPVHVIEAAADDMMVKSLIENVHRKGLSAVEREAAVRSLWETGRWATQSALAKSLSKTQGWVSQNLTAQFYRERYPALQDNWSTDEVLARGDWLEHKQQLKEQRKENGEGLKNPHRPFLMLPAKIERTCPRCHGSGRVWSRPRPRPGLRLGFLHEVEG